MRRPIRLALAAIAGVVVMAGSQPALAGDNDLGTSGKFTYLADSSPIGPGAAAAVTVDCPPGTRLAGGGMSAVSGSQQGQINTAYPIDGPDGDSKPDDRWHSDLFNNTATGGDASAFAVCAEVRLSYKTASGEVAPGQAKTVKARCGRDTQVTGGGVYVSGVVSEAWVSGFSGFDSGDRGQKPDDGWRARVYNVPATLAKDIIVYAICSSRTVKYVVSGHSTNQTTYLTDSSPCPSTRHLTAGGEFLLDDASLQKVSGIIAGDGVADADMVPDDLVVVEGWSSVAGGINARTLVACL